MEINWENIIWREWRNCEDRVYAQKLFELVADKPAKAPIIAILIILMGFYFGLIGGLLAGNLIGNVEVFFNLERWHLVWNKKFILGGILIGISLGFLVWLITFNLWTWRQFILCMVPRVEPMVLFVGPAIIGTIFTTFYSPFSKMEIDFLNLINLNLANLLLGSLFGGLFSVLMGGMIIGLVYGTVGGLCGGLIVEFLFLLGYPPFGKISEELKGALVLGVIFELFLGFSIGLFYVFFTWISKKENLNWIDTGRVLWIWWKKRPFLSQLEKALKKVQNDEWIQIFSLLEKNKKEPPSSEELISNLESLDWKERFMARHLLLYLGGEVVELLIKKLSAYTSPKNSTIVHLLQSIAYETQERLSFKADRLVCPYCMVYVGANQINFGKKNFIIFYGCRSCYQSRNFYDFKDTKIVLLLHQELEEEKILEDKVLKINWFKHKKLFDFNWVEIFQASDEDIERFCIQIGNDGDRIRRKNYKRMFCFIREGCNLKLETINMLKNTFREVIIRKF